MKKIKLTQGKFAIVDDDMFEYINQWKWWYNAGYAVRVKYLGGGRKHAKYIRIHMHRLINNTPKDVSTDHINRNKLDNRKSNLRNVDNQKNHFNRGLQKNNTSGVKGVVWDKESNKWLAQIQLDYRNHTLGRYSLINDAIIARQEAERIYHVI